MSIEDFIASKTQQKADTEPVTVRLAQSTVALIDDLASTLDVTRQEMISEFVKDSLSRALAHFEKTQNKPEYFEQSNVPAEEKAPCYVFLNTNKVNDISDHTYMLSNGIAAAFYGDWKTKIDTLKKGDIVFLYESGVGIVGVGKANGLTEKLDKNGELGETHQQRLLDYRKVKPLNARELKKLTGVNMRFLQVMFRVSTEHGKLIESNLQPVDIRIEPGMNLDVLRQIIHDEDDHNCEKFEELPAVYRDLLLERNYEGKMLKDLHLHTWLGTLDDAMSRVYDMNKSDRD